MHASTSDLRIRAIKPLIAPRELEAQFPLDGAGAEKVAWGRREIVEVLSGRDDRLLVVVGPCSIHDPAAALRPCPFARQRRSWKSTNCPSA